MKDSPKTEQMRIPPKPTTYSDEIDHPRAGKMPALPATRYAQEGAWRQERPATVTRLGGLIQLRVR